jgi:DNA-binding NarL/FixJ family response regulator
MSELRARYDDPPAPLVAQLLPDCGVLVVDGHPSAGAGLGGLLRAAGLDVLGEAHDAGTAADIAGRCRPDVILMDLQLPGLPALDAVRLIGAASPRSRIVVLSASADNGDGIDALAAGAYGCILRSDRVHQVVTAVRAAAQGESVLSPAIATDMVRRLALHVDAGPVVSELTRPELDVLTLVARGWDNARIAGALYLSRGTVKNHVSSILAKLEVENRIQAAVIAVQRHLIEI